MRYLLWTENLQGGRKNDYVGGQHIYRKPSKVLR